MSISDISKSRLEETNTITPIIIHNPPGSYSLGYRVGTHSLFKTSMYYDLVSKDIFSQISNQDDDLRISLIDCWAMVSDVLTFYQERIANEGFLRTSKERLSVLELSKSIGRKLDPGSAATTFLAFTLDEVPGKTTKAIIGPQIKVQSIPGQDELPQMFETVEKLNASSEWNSVRPKLYEKQNVSGKSKVFLEGTNTGLRLGDNILIVISDTKSKKVVDKVLQKVIELKVDLTSQTTTVLFDSKLPEYAESRGNTNYDFSFFSFQNQVGLFGHNADHTLLDKNWEYLLEIQKIVEYLKKIPKLAEDTKSIQKFPNMIQKRQPIAEKVLDIFERANVEFSKDSDLSTYLPNYYSVKDFAIKKNKERCLLYLDNAYSEVIPDSWIILKNQTRYDAYKVNETNRISLNDFGLNYKVNVLDLDSSSNLDLYKLPETTAYVGSKKLTLASSPVNIPVNDSNRLIYLEKKIDGLKEKQSIAITGKLEDDPKTTKSEVSEIISIQNDLSGKYTILELDKIDNSYKRDTVFFNFNVLVATHGETKTEILGSGNPSQTRQKFVLKGKPVTYVSSGINESGSTLEVRVNDELWKESENFLSLKPNDKSYITQIGDDGSVSLIFGDGIHGMRPPTGQENIHVKYRLGMGKAGLVNPNQLSLVLNRPLGVRSVTNPVSARNASDPESLDDAKKNAPIKLLTMNRIVSLDDFKSYADSYNGVGKSLALWGWNGFSKIVHLVVSDNQGLNADSLLRKNLEEEINSIKDPMIQFTLCRFNKKTFNIDVKILVDSNHQFEKIKKKIVEELSQKFSFEAREFGQNVTNAEVMSVIQRIPGVIAVDVDKLYITDENQRLNEILYSTLQKSSRTKEPVVDLLTINDDGITIKEISQ